MSRSTVASSRNRRRTIGGTVLGALAALGVAALVVTPSGADFSASDTGRVDVSTATLSLNLSDAKGSSGTFDLDFVNLAPGDTLAQTFTVTNTGSIPADVKLGNPITQASLSGGQLTGADFGELKVGVAGYQALVPAPSLSSGVINLGSLGAGETKTYSVQVSLDQSAGNEWQGVKVGANATVTLSQR